MENMRPKITQMLSKLTEQHINPNNDTRIYWAKEVTFDYSYSAKRVDYMRFKPLNNSVSGIEKGDCFCYEIKSSVEDFHSPNGHNFLGDFKGINNPKLKEDVNIVGENLMIGVLKAGLGEKADIIDKNMEKLYASATKANVEIISNKEAATVTGISKKFSKTDFVFSRTRVNDKQIVSFYKTVTITNEDGTTDIKTDINSKDNFFFKVTFEDYTKLEENQFDIDEVLMVQNKDDSCTLYYVYNDDTQDDPITTEEDIPSTAQPQTTLVDDIVQPSTDTEDGVISGNPETGNKMLMPGIVAISLLSLSALAVVFLRRKETN